MSWLSDVRVIRFFSFYLTLMFLVSTYLRLRQYQASLALVRALPQRYPNLLRLLRQHSRVFLNTATVRPVVIVLVLLVANTVACRLIWPTADDFTGANLFETWPVLPFVLITGPAMLAFDIYTTARVGIIDREMMEKYFDQAEYWLRSWQAPVVTIVTLGYVDPRKIVDKEVQSALVKATELLNSTLWWVSIQTGLRIAFGLSLWISYALHSWLLPLLHGS
jgi:hypothetical protein